MILAGYQIKEKLYESIRSQIYRGLRETDHQPVVLKRLNREYPSYEEVIRFKREYELTSQLNFDGIIKPYGLEKDRNTLVIVLEDFAGEALSTLTKPLKINDFLFLAKQLVQVLGNLHQQHVMHKDLNPSNILWNRSTGQVKIIDFGISTALSRENPQLRNVNTLEGTLAYISPEQTGRMNRVMDYRTDFYSLGVTCYELLTGQLPFSSSDAMELVHCHIAKTPLPPHQLNSKLPLAISDIVMKLMAKTAEERYQSAFGLQADLQFCWEQWTTSGEIYHFVAGQHDVSGQFQIPQHLYGRETEMTALLEAFARVSEGTTEMMLVAGYSGVGKSALVAEIHKPIVEKRGYFIAGKFDQFNRNTPYSALIQAFQALVRYLLAESAEQLARWQTKLLSSLEQNGQIIIEVIPEVELIIGPQSPVLELPPTESQNRFNAVFQQFIRTFAHAEHPLVMFLDDLQWADSPSLKLLEHFMAEGARFMLIIGAYRDNEVSPAHPLMLMRDNIQKGGATVNTITLAPLALPDLQQLLTDTLQTDRTQALAELCFQKTAGNPFFLTQFLRTLYEEQLISFSQAGQWEWDLARIQKRNITDNVVELMVAKLRKLPLETQQVLQLAACIGNTFDLKTLAIVYEQPPTLTAKHLHVALQAGLCVPQDDAYKFVEVSEDRAAQFEAVRYKFLHDRVQQAAYSLISPEQKTALHLSIGRLLLEHIPVSAREERIFELVNHLNRGNELITSQNERDLLGQLNLLAANKARTATAHDTALKHFRLGSAFLSTSREAWENHYDTMFALAWGQVECEYLCGNMAKAETIFHETLSHAKTRHDQASLYELMMNACLTFARFNEGAELGRKALRLFEVELPAANFQTALAEEYQRIETAIAGRTPAELWQAVTENPDPDSTMATRLLHQIWTDCFFAEGLYELGTLAALKIVTLSLQQGYTSYAPFGYIVYALNFSAVREDYETAYGFGLLARRLQEKFNNPHLTAKVNNLFAHMVSHYRRHLKENLPLYEESYRTCLQTGDLWWGIWAVDFIVLMHLIKGDQLATVVRVGQKYAEYAEKSGNMLMWQIFLVTTHIALSLQGKTLEKTSLSDATFEEDRFIEMMQVFGFGLFWHDVYKSFLLFLHGQWEAAWQVSTRADRNKFAVPGLMLIVEQHFYHGLIVAARYASVPPEEQASSLAMLREDVAKMHKWSQSGQANYQHKYFLLAAELARLTGDHLPAMEYYDQAIESAHQHEYLQNEALANELAAKFYLACGKPKAAKGYLIEAYYLYQQWGAVTKLAELEASYPRLAATQRGSFHFSATTTSGTQTCSGEFLDLYSVIKASQTLSGEIVLDRLLQKMMQIVIENAGAQRGVLFLRHQQQWLAEVEGCLEGVVLHSLPLEQVSQVPQTIVHYVIRTQANLVLSNAVADSRFMNDRYLLAHQPKSLLCAPLTHQGQLTAILYLENNLTQGAFTSDKLKILNVLSSQMTISIQNAKLYAEVRENERTLAQFLEAMPVGIFILDTAGKPYFVNQRGQELLGRGVLAETQSEQLAQAYESYLAGSDQLYPFEKLPVVKALQGERVSVDDIEIRQLSRRVPLEVWGTPIFNQHGQIIYAMAAFQDISDRKQAEANKIRLIQEQEAKIAAVRYSQEIEAKNIKLAETLQQLKTTQAQLIESEKMASLGNLVAGVAHEINTPLGIGITAASTLEQKTQAATLAYDNKQLKGSELKAYFDVATRSSRLILNNLERAGELVQSFKQVAVDQSHLERRRFAVKKYLKDTLVNLTPHLKRSPHQIIIDGEEKLEINSYPGAFAQIITNLVMNSLQHAYSEGQVGQMSFMVRGEGEQIILEYKDDGCGIPKENLSKIFEPFFTTRRGQGGTGLGLHIVYNLVTQKLKGSIRCDSEPAQGTTFILKLPTQLTEG